MSGEGSEGKKREIIVYARNARTRARENVDRVGERCFLGSVLKEGGALSISEMI